MFDNNMLGKDAVFAALAECYVTLEGTRYNFAQAINLEARMEKTKIEVPILGQTAKGTKAGGWTGTGSMTLHYNSSILRKLMLEYHKKGVDFYFDIQITNTDPTAAVGSQTTILKNCNLDNIIVAKFDADGEYLDEDVDFTFDDWEMPSSYDTLDVIANG